MVDESWIIRVDHMYLVTNKDGEPSAICPELSDATTFARCLGFDSPLDAMTTLPVVEFSRRGDRS